MTPAEIDKLAHAALHIECRKMAAKLAEIATVCGKYATPASVVSVHGLAKRIIGIVEGKETNNAQR